MGTEKEMQAIVFQPRDSREFRKLVNNVYVKNIPKEASETEIRELFGKYGNIKSLMLMQNELGQFGFVCYDDPQSTDKEYGPKCAEKVIRELNDHEMGENKLYIRHALKKADRE